MSEWRPNVPPNESPAEFTAKAIVLGIAFGLLFCASTVYLGLRAGLTVSASIPCEPGWIAGQGLSSRMSVPGAIAPLAAIGAAFPSFAQDSLLGHITSAALFGTLAVIVARTAMRKVQ